MDMLVKLYDLPDGLALTARLLREGITIRRALAPERSQLVNWVRDTFSEPWACEVDIALARQPVACYIALREKAIIGFACHDSICRNFFGPTGVDRNARGSGVGTALLLACLENMKNQGYAYAIIGGVGPAAYYEKAVGAVSIENSEPGIYRGLLGSPRFG
jgi:GNAT superfamily N-acetyltransferase